MKKQFDCLVLGASWTIPVPPMHDHFLQDALFELKAACAGASTRVASPAHRQRFEQEAILPVYDRVQRELAWLFRSWGVTLTLPEFVGTKETALRIRNRCDQTARTFHRQSSLQAAARLACVLWTLRHLGVELLENVWADASFCWQCRLGPQCYSHSNEFPEGVWDLAAGRETADGCLIKPFGSLLRDEGTVIHDPAWALLALRGEFEESFLGQLPFLPLLAWASNCRWPNRLWQRVETAAERCGPWVITGEREILPGHLGGDDGDPFRDSG